MVSRFVNWGAQRGAAAARGAAAVAAQPLVSPRGQSALPATVPAAWRDN
jgi:hypothetical protein